MFLLYFWAYKYSLGEHRDILKNIYKIVMFPNFWQVLYTVTYIECSVITGLSVQVLLVSLHKNCEYCSNKFQVLFVTYTTIQRLYNVATALRHQM